MKPTKEIPVTKNQQFTATVEDITYEGMGVVKVDGYPLFVENALTGEEVTVHVLKTTKNFGFAKVVERHSVSPDRVEEVQEDLLRTGIAPLSHLTYEAQLKLKENQVHQMLYKNAGLSDVAVAPIIGMENPTHYRNKAQIPVRKIAGELTTGFFRKNSHTLVPMEDFFIQEEPIDQVILAARDALRSIQAKPYDERDHTGNIRHIIVRKGHQSGELMVVFVTRTGKIFQVERVVKALTEAFPAIQSIIHNIHPERSNVILGKENVTLYGEEFITDQLLGNTYQISPQSFYQINAVQTEKLYQKAIEFADLKATDTVIDAYSGIGTIGLSIAKQVRHVYGMEVVKQAVLDAKVNALRNGLENVSYEVGKAEEILPKWTEAGVKADVLFVDPPRKGLEESFVEAAIATKVKKIVYISCNPATQARDLKHFLEAGYQLKQVQPVDMFPQTTHVENVVLLEKS